MKNSNTTLIYVLSSISLLCCCFAGLGIVLALPAYLMAYNRLKEVEMFPGDFELSEIKAMNNAKIFALTALVINALYLIYSIYVFSNTDWEVFMEQYQNALENYQI